MQTTLRNSFTESQTAPLPDKGYPVYPNMEDAKQRRRFIEFRAAIEGLLRDSLDRYHDLALDFNTELSDDDEPNPDDK